MASTAKETERNRKARAYRDLVKTLASVVAVYRPTASSIFDLLSKARSREQHARSSLLARIALRGENPGATPPEELSDQTLANYLTQAGTLYGNVANDYISSSDARRAYKYFRKAAQNFAEAAELTDGNPELREKARQYLDQAAIVRHGLARKVVRRRRWRLRFLVRRR